MRPGRRVAIPLPGAKTILSSLEGLKGLKMLEIKLLIFFNERGLS